MILRAPVVFLTVPLYIPQYGQMRWRLHLSFTFLNRPSRCTRSMRGLRKRLQDADRALYEAAREDEEE